MSRLPLPNHERVAAAVRLYGSAASQDPAVYDMNHWGNWFNGGVGSIPPVWSAAQRFDCSVNRPSLIQMAVNVIQGQTDVLEFFAAVMIWGDPGGRGRLHTHAVFNDGRLHGVLTSASSALQAGDLAGAYAAFLPGDPECLAGCRAPFFTKYLAFYSSGLRASGSDVPLALILDGRVEAALKVLADASWKRRLRGHSMPEKYRIYVEAATESAQLIGCDPSDVEFALFRAAAQIWNPPPS